MRPRSPLTGIPSTSSKPVEWIPREQEKKMVSFQVDPEFHDRLKVFAESSGLKISQLCRYALAREIDST